MSGCLDEMRCPDFEAVAERRNLLSSVSAGTLVCRLAFEYKLMTSICRCQLNILLRFAVISCNADSRLSKFQILEVLYVFCPYTKVFLCLTSY